ncbi:mitotic checkpoint protein BUB3-like protein [Hyaloraphidium curvatum]|nr:mitotic checkpoint protein BUB3-like protein [Hyaloraphidium curvatum]
MEGNFELSDPPTDGISAVAFAPSSPNFLLVASWDRSVRLYDVQQNQLRTRYEHKGPVLDVCWSDATHGFSVGLDKRVKMMDFNVGKDVMLGRQEDTVRNVAFSHETGSVITGSWDKTVQVYDPRSPGPNHKSLATHLQPAKVFSLDVAKGYKLVVAMAGRHVYIYDLRNMKETLQRRESSLKFMTRMVRCMPNGEGYASSSIEGRVAVEFFDPDPEVQKRKYAFKCHRQTIDGVDTVFPVNALAYHPIHGTFASGGGDGVVALWDGFNKKRLRQYPRYPSSIASLCFNADGTMLAVASSYTFEEGEKDHMPDSIYIRALTESETKPKTMPPGQSAV